MKKYMIVLLSSLFFVSTFTGAGMASGDGDDERYERHESDDDRHDERDERYEREDERGEERYERDGDWHERGERGERYEREIRARG